MPLRRRETAAQSVAQRVLAYGGGSAQNVIFAAAMPWRETASAAQRNARVANAAFAISLRRNGVAVILVAAARKR